MTALMKPSEVASIGKLGLLGMASDVIIKKAVPTSNSSDPNNVYGDDAQTFVEETSYTGVTVQGWLSHKNSPVIGETGGKMAIWMTYKLYLPVGTDVVSGDRVSIGGQDYIVSDTTAGHTWLPWLSVSLRRVE